MSGFVVDKSADSVVEVVMVVVVKVVVWSDSYPNCIQNKTEKSLRIDFWRFIGYKTLAILESDDFKKKNTWCRSSRWSRRWFRFSEVDGIALSLFVAGTVSVIVAGG